MFRRANIKLMIYEIEGIPAISRVNPHVPTPCIIPPRPCPPCTRSHHRLNNFPNTVSIYMRAQTSSLPLLFPCVRTFYVRPCGATDAPIFSVTCFLSLSPPYLFIFPFVGRLPEFPSRDTVIPRFSSRHDCFQSSISLSLSIFSTKKSIVVVDESRASFFLRFSRHLVSFFFFLSPFVARQRSLILNCGGYIYIRNQSSSISIVRTRSNVSSRGI